MVLTYGLLSKEAITYTFTLAQGFMLLIMLEILHKLCTFRHYFGIGIFQFYLLRFLYIIMFADLLLLHIDLAPHYLIDFSNSNLVSQIFV